MSEVEKALVVGGGIGGLCAATALRMHGVEVDLIERNTDWSVYGVGIIQPNNTLRALDRLGLAQACVDEGAGFPGWQICDAAGRVLFEAAASNSAAPAFPPVNGITRSRLHQILLGAAERSGATIRLGTTVSSIVDDGTGVTVEFSDESQARYDVMIGCDGVSSQVRPLLFPDAPRPAFTGQGVWRYNFHRPADQGWGAIYNGPTSKAGLVPLSPVLMYLFLVTHEPGNPQIQLPWLADELVARLAGYGGVVARLREQVIDPEAVVYRPMEKVMLASPWHRGRAIVIGDAAHATTPHLAQGAAMAIEDAVLLAELIGSERRFDDAMSEFMRRRFDRTKFVVDTSQRIAETELDEWAGRRAPDGEGGKLLHAGTLAMLEAY